MNKIIDLFEIIDTMSCKVNLSSEVISISNNETILVFLISNIDEKIILQIFFIQLTLDSIKQL